MSAVLDPVAAPGRSCPLHYRYRPQDLAVRPAPALDGLDVLYVVGGLYGNLEALDRVLHLFDAERGRKALVFNGDFHWFDAEPRWFDAVQRSVMAHAALRGNVETELAGEVGAGAAGCGCAYPDWVDQAVVDRSNRIHAQLHRATTAAQRQELGQLPMWLRADVAGWRVAIVHGDAQSLAGWGFAQEHLREASHRRTVQGWFAEAGVDAFACTHTCLPVFQGLHGPARQGPGQWVLNNGAAGMPNFRGDPAGLFTRIAFTPFAGPGRRFGVRAAHLGLHIDAIAIEHDTKAWHARFLATWPPGTDAHASYFERIALGPSYSLDDAVRLDP